MKNMRKIIFIFALLMLAGNAIGADLVVDAVNYTPAPALPGEYLSLYIHLKNDSKYLAENVQFELDLSGGTERDTDYPFSLGTGVSKEKTIAGIQPHKTALLEYRVRVDPSALDGDYSIVFKFKEAETQKEYRYTVKVLSRKPDIEVVEADETVVSPGQTIELGLTLRNTGSGLARDILIGLEEDRTVTTGGIVVEREFSALGASFAFVKSLEADKEARAKILLAVNPDAEQKTYMVPLKIKYKDTNANSYTTTTYIGLKVTQEPQLDAVVSSVEPLAFPGGTSEVTVDLFNVGIGTAKYVVAEIATEAGELEQEKVFIGTLEADDFDSFKVKLRLEPQLDPAREHSIKLLLSYKNQYGEERQSQKTLPLEVHSDAEAQAMAGSFSFLAPIALLLQLLGLYAAAKWVYKKLVKS
jgi:hypothetical protein